MHAGTSTQTQRRKTLPNNIVDFDVLKTVLVIIFATRDQMLCLNTTYNHSLFFFVFQVPPIDSSSSVGMKPDKLIGNIEFKNVVFRYPSRMEVPVCTILHLVLLSTNFDYNTQSILIVK